MDVTDPFIVMVVTWASLLTAGLGFFLWALKLYSRNEGQPRPLYLLYCKFTVTRTITIFLSLFSNESYFLSGRSVP